MSIWSALFGGHSDPQPGAQYALDQPVELPGGAVADGLVYTESAGWVYGVVTEHTGRYADLGTCVEPGWPVYGADGPDAGAWPLPAAR